MEEFAFHTVTFGIPLVLYVLWLWRLQKQCPFLGLLIVAIVAVWITLWPVYYAPEYQRASEEVSDRADTVVNGFILLGWFNGVIGCLPIILVEIPRSIVLALRNRSLGRAAQKNPNGEQGGARQPATAPESKPEGEEKPKPESEVRPQ